MASSQSSCSEDRADEERQQIVSKYLKGRDKLARNDELLSYEDPDIEMIEYTDRYGFIHKEKLADRLTQHENKLREQEAKRSQKWVRMLEKWDKNEKTDKMRQRVYKGIPNNVRGRAWSFLMGIPAVKQQNPGKYQTMKEWGLLNSPDVRQIDLDVNRTFRNNSMFRDRYAVKQQELFYILVAYSVYNAEIGYCQGMSQIAALLLMYLDEEEDVFWAMDRLMTAPRYSMHGLFIHGFPKLTRFSHHHDLVLKKFLPRVYKHFKKFDITSTLYCLKWFFQCFLDRVPFSLTLRLWDCYMLEGEMILTCMSYTLLKLHKRTLIKKSMENLLEFLQIDLEKDFGYHDDEAITNLQNSIAELKKHKMEVPKEPPGEDERPHKPFGYLLQMDNISIATTNNDDQSVVGSIRIMGRNGSIVHNSDTSEDEDNGEDDHSVSTERAESRVTPQSVRPNSRAKVDVTSFKQNGSPSTPILGDRTSHSRASNSMTPTPQSMNLEVVEPIDRPRSRLEEEVESFIDESEESRVDEPDQESKSIVTETIMEKTFTESVKHVNNEVVVVSESSIVSTVNVIEALTGASAIDSDFMQEWPDSGRFSRNQDTQPSRSDSGSPSRSLSPRETSKSPVGVSFSNLPRKSSIPMLANRVVKQSSPTKNESSPSPPPSLIPSPTKGRVSSPMAQPSSSTSIPRTMRASPTSSRRGMTTIYTSSHSTTKVKGKMDTDSSPKRTDGNREPNKVSIFVPFSTYQEGANGIPKPRDRKATLPVVDT